MFRRMKMRADGILDRRHLYRTADLVVTEVARDLDAFFTSDTDWAKDVYREHVAYFKAYMFRGGTIQLRYLENGEGLVEIAVYNQSRCCVFPPPDRWSGIRHDGHGPGFRLAVYDDEYLRRVLKEVTEWTIRSGRQA